MATLLLVLVVVLVIAGLVYGVVTLIAGDDPGLVPAEADGRARPLPNDRSLHEDDLKEVRFDVALRGYRMSQVDRVLRRTAYDLGYKDEMIAVLEAEVAALREGRYADAEVLRQAREEAASTQPAPPGPPPGEITAEADRIDDDTTHDGVEVDDLPGEQLASDERPDGAEPREGSLLRRNPMPDASKLDTAAALADGQPELSSSDGRPALDNADGQPTLDGADGQPALDAADRAHPLEVADRPAHA